MSVVQDVTVYRYCHYPLSTSDDEDIRELEKLNIKFLPKEMKNGGFVDTYDRDRRVNREKSREKLDLEMIGLVKKKKKSNQATKKIQWAVDEKRRKNKRVEARAKGRAERKAKHQTF